MKDGKGKFFSTLNLDKETKKLIRNYRKVKPEIINHDKIIWFTKPEIKGQK